MPPTTLLLRLSAPAVPATRHSPSSAWLPVFFLPGTFLSQTLNAFFLISFRAFFRGAFSDSLPKLWPFIVWLSPWPPYIACPLCLLAAFSTEFKLHDGKEFTALVYSQIPVSTTMTGTKVVLSTYLLINELKGIVVMKANDWHVKNKTTGRDARVILTIVVSSKIWANREFCCADLRQLGKAWLFWDLRLEKSHFSWKHVHRSEVGEHGMCGATTYHAAFNWE